MNTALKLVCLLAMVDTMACATEAHDEASSAVADVDDLATETETVASAAQASVCIGITVCNSTDCWCVGLGAVDPNDSCHR